MVEIALTCANATLNVNAEGTFHLRWTPGSALSAAVADAVVAAVQDVTGASLQPILVEVVDGRETLLGMRFVSAVALIGATAVDRVMAAALLREQDCRTDTSLPWTSRLPVPDALEESAGWLYSASRLGTSADGWSSSEAATGPVVVVEV